MELRRGTKAGLVFSVPGKAMTKDFTVIKLTVKYSRPTDVRSVFEIYKVF